MDLLDNPEDFNISVKVFDSYPDCDIQRGVQIINDTFVLIVPDTMRWRIIGARKTIRDYTGEAATSHEYPWHLHERIDGLFRLLSL